MSDTITKHRFGCLPFTGKKDGKRFYVVAATPEEAVTLAKEEAKKTEFDSVFVETKTGRQIYEGLIN